MYRSFFDVCSLTSEYVNSFDSAMVGSGGEVLVCVCGGRVPVCCEIGMCRQREEEEEEDSRGRQHRCQLEVQRRRDKSVRR